MPIARSVRLRQIASKVFKNSCFFLAKPPIITTTVLTFCASHKEEKHSPQKVLSQFQLRKQIQPNTQNYRTVINITHKVWIFNKKKLIPEMKKRIEQNRICSIDNFELNFCLCLISVYMCAVFNVWLHLDIWCNDRCYHNWAHHRSYWSKRGTDWKIMLCIQ